MYELNVMSFSILFLSSFLSLYKCFYLDKNEKDFYPLTIDKNILNKSVWYLSHFTHTSNLILLFYFFMKLFNYNYDYIFISISPICFSVNFNYFLILYPKYNIRLYNLSFSSIISHFYTSVIILNEIKYIEYFNPSDIILYNYFIIIGIFITFLNYKIRNIWTYNLVNLYTMKGWILFFQFKLSSLFFRIFLYNYYNFII